MRWTIFVSGDEHPRMSVVGPQSRIGAIHLAAAMLHVDAFRIMPVQLR
jgi:hypothetical protein